MVLTAKDLDVDVDLDECGYVRDGVFFRWKVSRLIEAARRLKPFDYDVSQVDLTKIHWFLKIPNVEEILHHYHKLQAVDLSYPIILAPDGRILDGFHRIVKARLTGVSIIKAVQLVELPEPDKEEPANWLNAREANAL